MRPKPLPRTAEPLHGPLAQLARRQHGVVSIDQMIGPLAYSRSAATRAAAAARMHRLHRGVYAVGHTDLSLHGQCLAAVLACGSGALLSHYSAAWLWGLARWSPVPLHVTGPNPRRPRGRINLHHSTVLVTEDHDTIERIPVTAVARTALDLAAKLRPDALQRLLQRADELKFFDLRRFEAVLTRAGGHHGAGRLRRALQLYRPPPFTRSGVERRFLDLVIEAGLPRPITAFCEAGYELDVYWPEERFAVELDIYETHGSRLAFEEDRVRDENLKLAGVELVRITGHRLDREPQQVIARVARLLEQRRGPQPHHSGAVEL